jgi:fibronectin-binding autotransporter adhesin
MKKTSLLPLASGVFLAAFAFTNIASAQTTYDWLNTAPDGNWTQGASGARWSGGLFDIPPFGVLSFNNDQFPTMTNNVGGTLSMNGLIFGSFATVARNLTGNTVRLFDSGGTDPKISSDSAATHTISLNLEGDGDAGDPLQINLNSSGGLIFNGTINNQGSQIDIVGSTASAATATFNGVISGAGAFAKNNGNTTAVFATNHTYNGDTFINAGTLRFNSGGSASNSTIRLGDTAGTVGATLAVASGANVNSGTIVVRSGSSGVKTITSTASSGTATVSGSVFLDAAATVNSTNGGTLAFTGPTFDLKAQTLTVNNAGNVSISSVLTNSTGNGTLTKAGAGTLSLTGTGASSILGALNVNGGASSVLEFDLGAGSFTLGGAAGGAGNGKTTIGYSGSAGTVNWKSGTGNFNGSNWFVLGDGNQVGNLNVSGGALNLSLPGAQRVLVGLNSTAGSTLTVSGGTMTIGASGTNSPDVYIGGGPSFAANNSIGTVTVTNSGLLRILGSGILNLGKFTAGNTAMTGTINLEGGTFETSRNIVKAEGTGNINFNGGTLKAATNSTAFLTGLTAATVKSNGAIIDTAGFNITIGQALLAGSPSGGLTKNGAGTLILSGANTYSGNSRVTAGTLELANASALQSSTLDMNSGDAGTLSFGALTAATFGGLTGSRNLNLLTTNASPLAVVLSVGNNNANTTYSGQLGGSGGITKVGSGTLTLTGANTNTGNTTLGGGTLVLSNGNNRLRSGSTVVFTAASTLDVGDTTQTLNGLTLLGAGQMNTIRGIGGTLLFNPTGDQTWNTTATGTTVNMSNLSNFTVTRTNATTNGAFQINANGASVTNTVFLARSNNTFNADAVRFGGGANVVGQNVILKLGQTNLINVGLEFVIAYFQGNGDVSFQDGLSAPSLIVRGGAGGSTAAPIFSVGSCNSGNQPSTGILNLTGGSLDAIASDLYVGRHFANAGGTASTGTITMPNGTVVANNLYLAAKTGATTGAPNLSGTFNQGGGSVTATNLFLGFNSNVELPNLTANYNLSGGTLFATTIAGSGANYGASTVRNLNLNGGTVRNISGADLSVTGLADTTSGRINVSLGASGGTFEADSGRTVTLGASTRLSGAGNLTKTGAGTLILSSGIAGANTGALNISNGVVQLNATGVAAAGTVTSVAVGTGATLLISQSDQVNNSAAVTLSGGTIARASGVSEKFGALDLTAASTLDYVGGTAGTLEFGVYEGAGTPSHVLTINNFALGNVLKFGSNLTGFIPIGFTSGGTYNNSYFSINGMEVSAFGGFRSAWDSGSSTFTITSVPEPSTVLAALGLTGLMLWPARRRIGTLLGRK